MENKENTLVIKCKRKESKPRPDKSIIISGELHSILNMYSETSGIPIKNLVDLLLKFALDRMTIVFDDEEERIEKALEGMNEVP